METYHYSKRLNILFSLILFLTIIGFAVKRQYLFIYHVIFIYFAFLLFAYFERKMQYKVRNDIKALVMLSVIFHIFFGEYLDFYNNTEWFDNFLHFFGSFSFALFYYTIIRSTLNFFTESKIFLFILIFSVSITGGVFFEILEFILDIIFHSNNQNGLVDTNLDLIFDILGSALAGAWGIFIKVPLSK